MTPEREKGRRREAEREWVENRLRAVERLQGRAISYSTRPLLLDEITSALVILLDMAKLQADSGGVAQSHDLAPGESSAHEPETAGGPLRVTGVEIAEAWRIVDAFRERLVHIERTVGEDNWRCLANQIMVSLAAERES